MRPCATHVSNFLDTDSSHVAALHCKAGKGRTGVMVSAYLLQSGICQTAEDAMNFFARARTHDGKGVTIPSQKRYVRYFASNIGRVRPLMAVRISRITIQNCPISTVAIPALSVTAGQEIVSVLEATYTPETRTVVFEVNANFIGDIKIMMMDQRPNPWASTGPKIFWCWLHSSFIDGQLVLTKSELDGPMKKDNKKHERFDPSFTVLVDVTGSQKARRLVDAPNSGITGNTDIVADVPRGKYDVSDSRDSGLVMTTSHSMESLLASCSTPGSPDSVISEPRNRSCCGIALPGQTNDGALRCPSPKLEPQHEPAS